MSTYFAGLTFSSISFFFPCNSFFCSACSFFSSAAVVGAVTVGDGAFVVGGVMPSSSFIGETVGFKVSCFGGGGGTGTVGAALAGVVAGAGG